MILIIYDKKALDIQYNYLEIRSPAKILQLRKNVFPIFIPLWYMVLV